MQRHRRQLGVKGGWPEPSSTQPDHVGHCHWSGPRASYYEARSPYPPRRACCPAICSRSAGFLGEMACGMSFTCRV